ncbi:MAG: hydrogenase, partial [Desulfobacterales bacterium]|nr:hydrogenase [Desulfobacterales bacterium]
FLQGGATYGRLRTAVINATMRASGSRFGRGWLRPGGVRHRIDDERRQDLNTTIADVSADLAQVNALVLSARSVQARFQGIGVVDRQTAGDIGLVGLVARASAWALDIRASMPGRLYASLPLATLTEDSGDCWARLKLRMREIDESIRWIGRALQEPAAATVQSELQGTGVNRLRPDTMCVSACEGFRGPVFQALETGTDGRLIHYKVQDPSLQNWFGLAQAMRENEISDFPICNKSFDLSYCGNDL